jgi:hypothetical protein
MTPGKNAPHPQETAPPPDAATMDASDRSVADGAAGTDLSTPGEADGPLDAGADARPLEAIRVFRGSPDAPGLYDLRFVGSGLDQYEGAVVTFRIGDPRGSVQRLGSGQVRIVGGTFDVLFPKVLESLYLPKRAHIDANGDGTCEAGEPLFSDYGAAEHDMTLRVTPDAVLLRPAAATACAAIHDFPIQ